MVNEGRTLTVWICVSLKIISGSKGFFSLSKEEDGLGLHSVTRFQNLVSLSILHLDISREFTSAAQAIKGSTDIY